MTTSQTDFTELKVLRFEGAFGPVPGHAIKALIFEGEQVTHVCIKLWDDVARMMVENVIHLRDWTMFQQRKWPSCGEVVAVLTRRGRRLYAKTMHAAHDGDVAWQAAPALTRTPFSIVALGGGMTLAEVAGVSSWVYSKRRPEDSVLILDPWKRDNEALAARIAARGAVPA